MSRYCNFFSVSFSAGVEKLFTGAAAPNSPARRDARLLVSRTPHSSRPGVGLAHRPQFANLAFIVIIFSC